MTVQELRCRRMVRLLPRWYRADREDEMVSTLLDAREADSGRFAEWREFAGMAGLSLRAWLAPGKAPARVLAVGDTLRLIALLGLLWGVMKGTLALGSDLNNVLRIPLSPASASIADNDSFFPSYLSLSADALLHDAGQTAAAAVPMLLLLAGRRRAAGIFAGIALVVGFTMFLASYSFRLDLDLLGYFLPQWLPLLLVPVVFPAAAPKPDRRSWLLALVSVAVFSFTLAFWENAEFRGLSWFVWTAALAIPGYLLFGRRRAGRTAAWSFSLAGCCALVLTQPLVLKSTMASAALEPLELVQVVLVGGGILLLVGTGVLDCRRG